jgi:hypothetical protein
VDRSANSGNRPSYEMTAMPTTAAGHHPPRPSVAHHLPEIYQECLENGDWVKVPLEVCGGVEPLSLSCRLPPPATPVPAPHHQCGKQVNKRRRDRDRRQREACIERRELGSLSDPLRQAGAETAATTSLASSSDAVVSPAAAMINRNDMLESLPAAYDGERHDKPRTPHELLALVSPPPRTPFQEGWDLCHVCKMRFHDPIYFHRYFCHNK